MSYYLLKIENYNALINENIAGDVKDVLCDLKKIADMLNCELRFDCINLNTTHVERRVVIIMYFVFSKDRVHKLSLICKQRDGLNQPVFLGSLLDWEDKEMDGATYCDFFEMTAELYLKLKNDIKCKIKDLDILINAALDKKEKDWFIELMEKKNFLIKKII